MTETLTRRAELLERLREICLPLPECKETQTWGNPTFVAGKSNLPFWIVITTDGASRSWPAERDNGTF